MAKKEAKLSRTFKDIKAFHSLTFHWPKQVHGQTNTDKMEKCTLPTLVGETVKSHDKGHSYIILCGQGREELGTVINFYFTKSCTNLPNAQLYLKFPWRY